MKSESISRTTEMPDYTYYIPTQLYSFPESAALFTRDKETPSDDPFLLVIMGGSARLRVNGVEQTAQGCFVVSCDKRSSLRLMEMQSFRAILIEYRCMTLNHSAPLPLPSRTTPHPCSHRVNVLANELEDAWPLRSDRPFQAHRLFLELLENVQLELEEAAHQGADWLQNVLGHIHLHYRDELTREQLALLAGVSPEHFSRAFHKHIGCTFNSYLNTLRIRNVQQQLLTGKPDNLHDLALRVGYKDGYYLSRKFKQVVGTAPMMFIRKPKRIVSANYNYTAMLLALQVQPVLGAYSSWIRAGQPDIPNDQERELFGPGGYGSYDQIQSLKPDVILGYTELAADMKLMSLAPVVGLPFMKLDWREQFRQIAEVADKQKQAEKLLERYNEQVDLANTKLDRELGGRGSLIIWEMHENGAFAFGNRFGRGGHVLYDDLGFHMPEQLNQKSLETKGYIYVSIEQMLTYPADYIVITHQTCIPQAERIFHSPSCKKLRAEQQRRQLVVPNPFDLFYGFDPLSTQKQLEMLVGSFTS